MSDKRRVKIQYKRSQEKLRKITWCKSRNGRVINVNGNNLATNLRWISGPAENQRNP